MVKCDMALCRHLKDEYCQLDSIELTDTYCDSCSEYTDEELHKDIFYKRTDPNSKAYKNQEAWVKTRGNKIEFLGREMFNRYGVITDGRTGAIVCQEDDKNKMFAIKNEFLKKCDSYEKEYGISPLYK